MYFEVLCNQLFLLLTVNGVLGEVIPACVRIRQLSEAATRGALSKQVLLNISQISKESTHAGVSF